MSRRGRGFAVVTGLFVAMLVYMLATILMANNQYNIGFTRHGYLQVQAQLLAQAATQQALAKLNTVPGWQLEHEGRDKSEKITMDGGALESWVEPMDEQKVRLIGVGSIGGRSQRICQILLKRPAVKAVDFALQNNPAPTSDKVFYMEQDGLGWNGLPNPPAQHWDDLGLARTVDMEKDGVTPKSSNSFKAICGDGQGNVYAIVGRSDHDEIMRYNTQSAKHEWELLPPILNRDLSGKQLGGRYLIPDLEGIAVNGERDLVVLDKRTGVDGLYHLDLSKVVPGGPGIEKDQSPWTQLLPPPRGTFDKQRQFKQSTNTEMVNGEAAQVCVDNNGQLYMLSRSGSPPAIYRYRPSDASNWSVGEWKVLPPPPRTYFTVATDAQEAGKLKANESLQEGGLVEHQLDDQSAMTLDYLAVDPATSQVFTRYRRPTGFREVSHNKTIAVPRIDTIFRLSLDHEQTGSKTALQLKGSWTADPLPPPNIHYNRNGEATEGGGRADLAYNTVDHASNLMGVWPSSGNPDTIFRCDLTSKQWKQMPPVPKKADEEDSGFSSQIKGLGGGGIPNPSGLSRYIPTVSY